jgi:molybdate transport system substrate-binding protein
VIRWIAAFVLVAAPAGAAELTVLTAGAFKPVAAALVLAFEARTGDTVILRNDTAGGRVRRIEGGEPSGAAAPRVLAAQDMTPP